jgi:hypothetical protein
MVTVRPERNEMTPDNKHNAVENFSTKFSRCVKIVVSAAISSPIALAT